MIVVTDSVAGLPEELIEQYHVKVMPSILTINGTQYRDNVDITPDKYWELFPSIKTFTTAAPSPGDFMDFFRAAGEVSPDILYIAPSRHLSGIHEVAVNAKKLLETEEPGLTINVVDSTFAVGAMALIVIEAVRAAHAGKTMEEVLQLVEELKKKVRTVSMLDTLKYLVRSGRAPRKALIGEWLGIKALVGMVDGNGQADSLGTVKGREQGFKRLVEMVPEYADVSKPLHVIIQYTNNRQAGEHLAEMVQSKYDIAELHFAHYPPTVCGHAGPLNSLSFYS